MPSPRRGGSGREKASERWKGEVSSPSKVTFKGGTMKKQFRSVLLVILFIVLTASSARLQAIAEDNRSSLAEAIKKFEEYVEERMALDKVPGLSVGFLKGDFTWAKGFGYSDLENDVPAKPESAYRLASITKTLTAISVLQLVEAGKIDLDAEVQAYVPCFPKKKWPVTVRLLLGHLGGISHYKNYGVEGRIKVYKNTSEALAIFQDFDLVAEPGTKYNYSSYGYNLLGAVIEGASGESYGDYIKKNIFKPLGMTNSRLDDPVDLILNRVRGYRLINGTIKNSEYVDVSSRFAGGGTRSTVVDLLKYANGIMDKKLLKEETWNLMFSSMATREGRFTGYGMGWGVRPWRGHFQVSHGGSQPETRTHILIFPTERFAVATASNREGLNLMPYVSRLAELVLGEDLDSSVYVTDEPGQIIYDCCANVFSYGMSQYAWRGKETSRSEKDLAEAFSYFNSHLKKAYIEKNVKEAKKAIEDGFHPVSNQSFIKVGSHMASTLKENLGEEPFHGYYRRGPLAFFSDYIRISSQWPADRDKFKFSQDFSRLVSDWEKDWAAVYPDFVRDLLITTQTDFDELGARLKRIFSVAKLYPDFSRDMEDVGNFFLEKDEADKSLVIFKSCYDLYPKSPASSSNLAAAHLWTGNKEEARSYFKNAFALDPDHPSVRLDRFEWLSRRLERANKTEAIFSLADIALELYPRNAELHLEIGNIYLKAGQKEKAQVLYRKALKLDPKLKEAKVKLKELKQKKK
jgi:CubicO group peptidase (beta-lactamase class C family)/tetratricopeptide (TPR) repeat protein